MRYLPQTRITIHNTEAISTRCLGTLDPWGKADLLSILYNTMLYYTILYHNILVQNIFIYISIWIYFFDLARALGAPRRARSPGPAGFGRSGGPVTRAQELSSYITKHSCYT